MTLQWAAVAFFLYAEIAVNIILCIPFISAQRWRLIFNWRIWSWLSPYWNRFFFTIIMVLIVLFLDALREVHKYSGSEPMQDAKGNPNLSDHLHMKLFRSQRNLYISGFSLFLWLIMRRVITLLNQVAASVENSADLQVQIDRVVKATKQHQEDNLKLKQALLDDEKTMSAREQQLKLEVGRLAGRLRSAEDALHKSQANVESMWEQAKGRAQEYDKLLSEHQQLLVPQEHKGTHRCKVHVHKCLLSLTLLNST